MPSLALAPLHLPLGVTLDLTFIAIVLIVAFAPPALFAASVARAKRYRREPSHAIRKAFLWGAIVAAGAALILNTYISGEVTRPYLQNDSLNELALALVVAPVVEEAVKALGIVLVASVRRHTDEVVDGIIYGAVIGLGFSATENLFYEIAALVQYGQGGYILTALARTFSSSLLHATATAVTGYGLARWLSGRSRLGAFAAVPWYILAVLLHAAFNAIAVSAVAYTIIPLVALGLFAFGRVKRKITTLSMVAPHDDWRPIGQGRSFRHPDEAPRGHTWRRVDEPAERWVPEWERRR